MASTTLTRKQVAPRKLVWIGPLAIIIAAIANLIIRAVAVTFLEVPETFQYMQAPYIISSTIIYLLMAMLAFVLVSRFTQRPIRSYRILVLVALCISLLSPVMALVGLIPVPHMSLAIFGTMIAMHIVSAMIVVSLFTTLTRVSHV